jgi:hypothetical protein
MENIVINKKLLVILIGLTAAVVGILGYKLYSNPQGTTSPIAAATDSTAVATTSLTSPSKDLSNMFVGQPCTMTNPKIDSSFQQDDMTFDYYQTKKPDVGYVYVIQRKYQNECKEILQLDSRYGFDVADFNKDGYKDFLLNNRRGNHKHPYLYNNKTKAFEEFGVVGAEPYVTLGKNENYTFFDEGGVWNTGDRTIDTICQFFQFNGLKKKDIALFRLTYDIGEENTTLQQIDFVAINGEIETNVATITKAELEEMANKNEMLLDGRAFNYHKKLQQFVENYWSKNRGKIVR